MITLREIANKGAKRVRHEDGAEFMLSVMQDDAGVVGILPFAIGAKSPRRGLHYLIPAFAREDYFAQLSLA